MSGRSVRGQAMSGAGGDFNDFPMPDFLSEGSMLKPKLDSIFAEVEQNLPDIDFEISDVSSEEDVPIFHRALRTPTSEDGDDRELDAMLSENTDNATAPTQPLSIDTEESGLAISLGNLAAMLGIDTSDISPENDMTELSLKQSEAQTERPKTAPVLQRFEPMSKGMNKEETSPPEVKKNTWVNEENAEEILSLEIERREEKRREIPELSPKGETGEKRRRTLQEKPDDIVQSYIPVTGAILPLETIDIDSLICAALTRTSNEHGAGEGSSSSRHNEQDPLQEVSQDVIPLIQRLAQMTMIQSGTELDGIDPETGALRRKITQTTATTTATTPPQQQRQQSKQQANQSTAPVRALSSSGTSTADLPNLPRELPAKKVEQSERETIYLDLRGFDKNKQEQQQNYDSIQRILKITQQNSRESSSDDDSESEDVEMWHEQRKKIKDALSKTGQLPKDLKTHRKKKQTESPVPKIQTHAQRLAGHLPPDGHKAKVTEDANLPEAVQVASVKKDSAVEVAEREKLRRIETAKKIREQKEQERQSRIRLGKRLEALRPTFSVGGKQKVAESTPTLFDVESSYEPAPKSLPDEAIVNMETVLLTVHLSSPGEIVQHRSSHHKSVDTGLGLSASYTTLLTWLLSLVPDNFDHPLSQQSQPRIVPINPVPFHVVGLQQLLVNGQLSLFVAVVPSMPIVGKQKKGKGTLFQQAISKYLSTNTLNTASPWLEDMVSLEVSAGQSEEQEEPFVYKPPLPNITLKPLSTFVQVNPDLSAVSKIFHLSVGFFWATIDTEESSFEYSLNDDNVNYDTQNTMSLIYKKVYHDPRSTMGILNRILQLGLDLAGVRLLYPTPALMNLSSTPTTPPAPEPASSLGPLLSLVVRGTLARTLWLEALGPSDPQLARRTDPASLCALYGGQTRDECLLFCPRNPSRVLSELCRWFGGRVPKSGVIDVGTADAERPGSGKRGKKSVTFADSSSTQQADTQFPTPKPPACLCATVPSDLVLVISPLLPPRCLGLLLATCQRRGFQLRGIRRLKLNTGKANSLGLSPDQLSVFTPASATPATSPSGPTVTSPPRPSALPASIKSRPASVLLLNKENAAHTAASLIEAIMVQLCLQGVLGGIQKDLDFALNSGLLFHSVPYTDGLLNVLGGDLTKTPEAELMTTPGYIAPELHTNPEVEQIVVLTFTGHSFMKNCGLFLSRLLNLVPYNNRNQLQAVTEGFELLGIKWLPGLSLQHAKELTPYEVGVKQWKPSIQSLTSEPALVSVLRGINAFQRLSSLISERPAIAKAGGEKGAPLDRIMSPSAELAYRQATLFFRDKELFADNSARSLLPYLPPVRGKGEERKTRSRQTKTEPTCPDHNCEESILRSMVSGPALMTSVLVLKPTAAHRHLAKILKRLVQEGFSVVGLKVRMLKLEELERIVPENDRKNGTVWDVHRQYLSSGPCAVLCVQRENAVKKLRDLVGHRDPKVARKQSSFLWRAMFGTDAVVNGMYVSSCYQTSMDDVRLFFGDGLCCKETVDLVCEGVICPAVDSVIGNKNREIKVRDKEDIAQGVGIQLPSPGPLTQTSCVLLTPALLSVNLRSKRAAYVDVINKLLSEGFEVVGGRMIWFSRPQVEQYLHLSDAGSFALAGYLTSGPCLVLALQRDNAILAFDSHLGSSFDKESILSRYGSQILRSKTQEQANKQLLFFFEGLVPYAQVCISEKQESETTK